MTDTSEIPYTDTFEEAADRRKDAEALLARHRIPVSPVNYRLGYEAVSGQHAQLQADFDQLVAGRTEPDLGSLWALYRKWFLQDETSLEVLRQELKRVLSDAQAQFRGSDAQFSEYADNLGSFASTLDDSSLSPARLSGEVRRMIDETREFESVQREAQSRIGTLVHEVETLRTELNRVREEAMTDGLTQIANRKAFDRSLEQSVQQAESNRRPLALLMIDVDHFKKFNDTYGHPVGDKVLRFVAQTIRNMLEGHGLVARYGGEEFAVLLPDLDANRAQHIAENVLNAVSSGELRDRKANQHYGRITVSIGMSHYQPSDEPRSLVERADAALYQAKQSGRNCVKRAA